MIATTSYLRAGVHTPVTNLRDAYAKARALRVNLVGSSSSSDDELDCMPSPSSSKHSVYPVLAPLVLRTF